MKTRIQSFDCRTAIYRQQLGKLVGVILLVCGLQESTANAATITTFDAAGAGTGQFQGTQAFSINPALAIVGYYIDTGGTTHCFLRAPNGTFTLRLTTGVPCYEVEDEEGRIHLLINLPIEEENDDRWCLWRPDQAGFDSRSIFDGALIEE